MPRGSASALVVLGGWIAVDELHALGVGWLPVGPVKWLHLVVMGAGAILILLRAAVRREERTAWLLLGLGVAAWVLGELYFTAVLWTRRVAAGPLPRRRRLSVAAAARLRRARGARAHADPGTAQDAAGRRADRRPGGRRGQRRRRVQADPARPRRQAALGRHQPQLSGRRPAAAGVHLRPAGDRRSATGPAVHDHRRSASSASGRRTRVYLVKAAEGTWQSGGPYDPGWWTISVCFAAAAWSRPPGRAAALRHRALISVPIVFALLSLAVLIAGTLTDVSIPAVALASCALLSVLGRLLLTFRAHQAVLERTRGEAITDPLTGLGQPACAVGRAARASGRSRAGADDPGAVRPRRVQELQRQLRPRRRRRAAAAAGDRRSAPCWPLRPASIGWAETSSARCCPAVTGARRCCERPAPC